MPTRIVYNNEPTNLKVQIYGSDVNQPVMVDNG